MYVSVLLDILSRADLKATHHSRLLLYSDISGTALTHKTVTIFLVLTNEVFDNSKA